MTVSKSDLVALVAQSAELSKATAQKAVDALFGGIMETLGKGDEVRIIGFGSFAVQKTKAREGRNPKTGEKLHIAESTRPVFRAGKELKEAVKS